MKFLKPVMRLVCFFKCYIKFINEICSTLCIYAFCHVRTYARSATKNLFCHYAFVSVSGKKLIHFDYSVSKSIGFHDYNVFSSLQNHDYSLYISTQPYQIIIINYQFSIFNYSNPSSILASSLIMLLSHSGSNTRFTVAEVIPSTLSTFVRTSSRM